MNKLSPVKIINNHTEVAGEESSFLLILSDCPVGGSLVGGRISIFLRMKPKFYCFILDFWTLQKWVIKVSLKWLRFIPTAEISG